MTPRGYGCQVATVCKVASGGDPPLPPSLPSAAWNPQTTPFLVPSVAPVHWATPSQLLEPHAGPLPEVTVRLSGLAADAQRILSQAQAQG